MNEWDGTAWAGTDPVQTRSEFDSFDTQLARITGQLAMPWRPASVKDALGVPAIYRAVTLISNTVGALSMEAIRRGERLDPSNFPRIIVRPNPFTIPREFYRSTAWDMATRGEAWWWIAKRDPLDDSPMSLYPMPASQVMVTPSDRDPLRPKIEWIGPNRSVVMRNEDVVQIVLSRDTADLRGKGPLQFCGAAASVAVEAQEWAANFFAQGGIPSVIIKSAVELSGDPNPDDPDGYSDAERLKADWTGTPANMPKVIDPTIESVEDFGMDPSKAQLTEARYFSNGESAVMFGIPASLLDHFQSGSSLTYQNVGQEFDKFVRACLWPNYLEPIEQAMSDLLTRSTVARFHVEGLLRVDEKTRWEIYELATKVIGLEDAAEMAKRREGLTAGDVDRAPIPFAPPQAIPTSLPISRTEVVEGVRCEGKRVRAGVLVGCGKLLAPDWRGKCPRCKREYPLVDATLALSAGAA